MKHLVVFIVCMMSFQTAQSCDACGCSINGDSWGIMPKYNIHFVGLRLQYRQYHNVHPDDHGAEGAMLTGDDYFYKGDLFGRFSINRRLLLTGTLPYRYNLRLEDGEKMSNSGMGDGSLTINYLPILPGCNDWKHALQVSAGVEAPTGKFTFSHDNPANMQLGSGTWDYLFSMNYTIRYRNVGMNFEGNYRYNGITDVGYDWGNSWTAGAKLFTTIQQDSTSMFMPWVGISDEQYESNIENTKYQIRAAYTGGYLVTWNAGFDYYSQHFGAGIEFGIPVVSELSDGYSKMKFHAGARLMYFIQTKKKNSIKQI